jgi:c-di-GMP-binding flagellar brake protein YcgR
LHCKHTRERGGLPPCLFSDIARILKIMSIDVNIKGLYSKKNLNGGELRSAMPLTDIETRVIKTCCDLNDKFILNIVENDKQFVYKSRFLAVDFNKKFIIIDEPSPETPVARPLSKGQYFEIFFEYRTLRYLFNSKVLELIEYKLHHQSLQALKILLPPQLLDGNNRDYFRVVPGIKPPIEVKFNIENTQEEFEGKIVDISGEGFAMKVKMRDKPVLLEKGDTVNARFKLKPGDELWEIWSEVRNLREDEDTRSVVVGMKFLGKEWNRNLNYYRNKILRYVTERQREVLAK